MPDEVAQAQETISPLIDRQVGRRPHNPETNTTIGKPAQKNSTEKTLKIQGMEGLYSPAEAYELAKLHGSKEAAYAYAEHMIDSNPEIVQQLIERNKSNNPILLPIAADERMLGDKYKYNAIPDAFAEILADRTGWEVEKNGENSIVQSNKAGRTKVDNIQKFARQATFAGSVEAGRNYIILDDHFANGGTARNLINYIESRGGNVVDVSTLVQSGAGNQLAPTQKDINRARHLMGPKNFDEFQKMLFGKVDPELFTSGELRAINTFHGEFEHQLKQAGQSLTGEQLRDAFYKDVTSKIQTAAVERRNQISPPIESHAAPFVPKAPETPTTAPKPQSAAHSLEIPELRPPNTASRFSSFVGHTGTALGAYGLYNQLNGHEREADLKAGGNRAAFANTSLSLNVAGLSAGLGSMAANTQLTQKTLVALSAVDDVANAARLSSTIANGFGNAAGIISIGAGTFDYMTAREAGDGYRAARVAGGVTGGIAGAGIGAGAGAFVGAVFPPLEVVTVPAGTLIGGLVGASVGTKLEEKAFGEMLQAEFDTRTQETIDDLAKQTLVAVSEDTLKNFTDSAKTSQKYVASLANYRLAATSSMAGTPEQKSKSIELLHNAGMTLAESTKEAEKLPTLGYEKWKEAYELRDKVRDLYNREVSRIVPEADKEAEQRRQDNIKNLERSYNRLQTVLAIDSVNGSIAAKAPEYLNHANEMFRNKIISTTVETSQLSGLAPDQSNLDALAKSNHELESIEKRINELSGRPENPAPQIALGNQFSAPKNHMPFSGNSFPILNPNIAAPQFVEMNQLISGHSQTPQPPVPSAVKAPEDPKMAEALKAAQEQKAGLGGKAHTDGKEHPEDKAPEGGAPKVAAAKEASTKTPVASKG